MVGSCDENSSFSCHDVSSSGSCGGCFDQQRWNLVKMREHLHGSEHLCIFVSFLFLLVSVSVFGTIQGILAYIEFERWEPPLVVSDCYGFSQATSKGIEGEEWEELYCHHRDMSKATGAKKPSESQKAKALWAMKAAKDEGDVNSDPARKEDIFGRTRTRLDLWKITSKTQSWPWKKHCSAWGTTIRAGHWLEAESREDCNGLQ